LKVREGELDVKEREISTRRRELEQWDSLLREKDRKVVVEQRQLEEREESLRTLEGKVRARELDCEKKSLDLRQKDAEATILVEKYTSLRQDLEVRERHCAEQTSKTNILASSLATKESSLASKEIQLKDLEVRFQDTKAREKELEAKVTEHNRAVDTFYNVKVAQITSRHAREMKELEELVQQQLQVVSNFQSELEKVRDTLSNVTREKDELKSVIEAKQRVIEKLEDDLTNLEEEKDRLKEEAVTADEMVRPAVTFCGSLLRPTIQEVYNE
jgi:chromosome segregation protein